MKYPDGRQRRLLPCSNDPDSHPAREWETSPERDSYLFNSSIVALELYHGSFKSRRREHDVAIIDALQFQVLEFDKEDARHAGEVSALLALSRISIGPYDALIAGQAKARNLTMVTHNTNEFRRASGLRAEDWQRRKR
jgi:tRNA(fMet)-specific endonuclease VapC